MSNEPQGSFADDNSDLEAVELGQDSLRNDIMRLVVKHDRDGKNKIESIALCVITNVAMMLDDQPDELESGKPASPADDDNKALASYLLREWNEHPAWVIDETCPNGKSAGELAIAILNACKAELYTVDRSCPQDVGQTEYGRMHKADAILDRVLAGKYEDLAAVQGAVAASGLFETEDYGRKSGQNGSVNYAPSSTTRMGGDEIPRRAGLCRSFRDEGN